MSGLDHLSMLAQGKKPVDDGLLGNARCTLGRLDLLSEEAIIAEFCARPFPLPDDRITVETAMGAAIIAEDRALFADLYRGRIGRLWRIGSNAADADAPALDVAFDPDMRQERGALSFRQEDHPDLDPAAAHTLLAAAQSVVEQVRTTGMLRVRGFVVRAFGTAGASAALLSLHSMSNAMSRSTGFSYAGIGIAGDAVSTVVEGLPPRRWTPRL